MDAKTELATVVISEATCDYVAQIALANQVIAAMLENHLRDTGAMNGAQKVRFKFEITAHPITE